MRPADRGYERPQRPPPLTTTFGQESPEQSYGYSRPTSTASHIIALYASDDSSDNVRERMVSSNDSYGMPSSSAAYDDTTPIATEYAERSKVLGRPLPPTPTSPGYRTKHSRSPLPPTPATTSVSDSSPTTYHHQQQQTSPYTSQEANDQYRMLPYRFAEPEAQRHNRPGKPLQHSASTASSNTSASSGYTHSSSYQLEPNTPPPWSPGSSVRSFSSPSEPSTSQHMHPAGRYAAEVNYTIVGRSGSGSGNGNGNSFRDDGRGINSSRGRVEDLAATLSFSGLESDNEEDRRKAGAYRKHTAESPSMVRKQSDYSSQRAVSPSPPFDPRRQMSGRAMEHGLQPPDRSPSAATQRTQRSEAVWSTSSQLATPRLYDVTPRQSSHHQGPFPQYDEYNQRQISKPHPGQMLQSPVLLTFAHSDGHHSDNYRSNTRDDEGVERCLLSNVAVLLRGAVSRGVHIKGSVSYPYSFTGKDIVSTIQMIIPPEQLAWAAGVIEGPLGDAGERKIALLIAASLKSQLFFHEVDWGTGRLRDGVEEVYMFLEDSLAGPSGRSTEQESSATALDRELSLATNRQSNNQHGAATAADAFEELPTGVFTALTGCYSPLCGQGDTPTSASCYSSSCPRVRMGRYKRNPLSSLTTLESTKASATTAGESHMAVAWADTVPKDFLSSLSKKEVKRQNAIHECIQKEEEFLHDLELLDNLFLARLGKPDSSTGDPAPIALGPEREDFIREVFSNQQELVSHIRRLVERLHVRQREDFPLVGSVGDIFLEAALEWGGAFETNMTNFPIAKHRINREASINPRFKIFLEACRRDPACQRLPMDNFLQRATTRLPRYNLHFKSILQDTEESNSDRDSLARAMEIIDEQCKTIQKGVAAAEIKVKIREYAYNLATKRNKAAVHMDLLNPERQLMHQGRVYRKPDFTDFEWQDLLAVLFDNYIVITKAKVREEVDGVSSKFILAKRPIPVEMIQLVGFSDPSVSRSIGLSNFHLRSNSERDFRDLYPFTIAHIAGRMEPLTLYVPSKEARDEWKVKLEEAIGLRAAVQEANKIFESLIISADNFAIPSTGSLDPERPPPGVDASAFHGLVTCAVPFKTVDGKRLIAIGCADGVWIGLRTDPRSLRKVLHLKMVTQCAVLENFGIFVVLADKVLIAYSLQALVPSGSSHVPPRPPQKLSGNRGVLFFSVGQLRDRTLLIYMKKKANESVFRALEPMVSSIQSPHIKSGGGGLFGKFGKDTKGSDWFRIYKTFFIPSEAYSMQFLRSKLCIVCARGFEIINLDSLLPGTIPDLSQSPRDDPRIQMLAKRVETAKPLGMFKNSDSEFLLCYDAFACYVDRLGEPIRLDNIVEWEGLPRSVAFRSPFILAFDLRFVEVRDCFSGQLVQLIRTTDLRNISESSATVSSFDDEDEGAILLVQRAKSNTNAASRSLAFDYQQVFQLVSTVYYRDIHRQQQQQQQQRQRSGSVDRDAPYSGSNNGFYDRPTNLNRNATASTFRTYASSSTNGPNTSWI